MSDQPLDEAARRLAEAVPAWDAGDAHLDDGVLLAFRAGRLDEAAHAQVAGHLAACADCRALLVAYAGVSEDDSPAMHRLERHTRPRRFRRRAALVAAAALAAGLFLLLRPSPPGAPGYRLDGPHGGLAATRGDDAPTRFAPGAELRLFARPAAPLEAPLPCAAYVSPTDGALRSVPGRFVTAAPNGVCRLRAPVEQLFDAPGAWRAHLVLGPGGDQFDGARPEAAREDFDGRWLSAEVRYERRETP